MYLREREDVPTARLSTEGLRVSISDWILHVPCLTITKCWGTQYNMDCKFALRDLTVILTSAEMLSNRKGSKKSKIKETSQKPIIAIPALQHHAVAIDLASKAKLTP